VETWIAQVAADPEVRLPGSRREALRERAQREGLALRPEVLQSLQALAAD
jgi:LDH2 family malate/lactate/ureidoglycolate dehydrogenase